MNSVATSGVALWRCTNCGEMFFPERLLCPRCRGDKFAPHRAHEAVIEEISVIRHMLGQENWQPRRIASVRTSEGPRMTVGLRDQSGPGATIELFEENGAPFGKAKA
jgi:uncharacterized OB-fold protein